MTSTAVIAVGMLTWVVMAILLALFLARMNRLNGPRASAVELPLATSAGIPALDPAVEAMDGFPAEPTRFVGR
ncbi:MAG: hypothetical protein LC749_22545, partial [Actinobacteria bacterium]|nr:hypothetical protein [Actinomycetota bacterium]MCA1697268.1 hypothetical protein [Actinomycetota bacterium]